MCILGGEFKKKLLLNLIPVLLYKPWFIWHISVILETISQYQMIVYIWSCSSISLSHRTIKTSAIMQYNLFLLHIWIWKFREVNKLDKTYTNQGSWSEMSTLILGSVQFKAVVWDEVIAFKTKLLGHSSCILF
jgi:hypothetical protein